MRKQLREITDKEEIKDLFRNTDVIRLAFPTKNSPMSCPYPSASIGATNNLPFIFTEQGKEKNSSC